MSLSAFTFTKRIVEDLEASAAFYCTVCGFAEARRIESAIGERRFTEIVLRQAAPEAAPLVLLSFDDGEPAAGDSILGFYTSDLTALVDRAQRAGGSVLQDIETLANLGVKVAYLRDNEGHLIEALERV